MAHFKSDLTTNLIVHAGPQVYGTFLTQINPNKPGGYRLNTVWNLTESEQNYSHLEKEMHACVRGCEHEHLYVFGIRYWISNDSASAIKIFEEKTPRKYKPIRLQRSKAKPEMYNCEFKFVSGDYLLVAKYKKVR